MRFNEVKQGESTGKKGGSRLITEPFIVQTRDQHGLVQRIAHSLFLQSQAKNMFYIFWRVLKKQNKTNKKLQKDKGHQLYLISTA